MIQSSSALKAIIIFTSTLIISCGPSEKQIKEEADKAKLVLQEETSRKAKELENAKIETLKSKVIDRLIDPASAEFRKVKLLQDNKGLCGEFNSKNNLGGYAGFSAFAVVPGGDVVILKMMTLDMAKSYIDDKKIVSQAVAIGKKINRGVMNDFLADFYEKKLFNYWNECAD